MRRETGFRRRIRSLGRTSLGVLASGILSVSASAAVTTLTNGHEGDGSEIDFEKVFVQHSLERPHLFDGSVKESDLREVLSDPQGRISSTFDVPKEIRRSVQFWLRVYVQYSREQVVIFDERDPATIYEVLDFSELRQKYRNDLRYDSKRRRKIWLARRDYRKAFRNLRRRGGRPRNQLERHIVRTLRKHRRRRNWSQLMEDMRFQTGQRDNVINGITIADRYFPWMEQIFRETGVPWELTRLGLVESSFNHRATSRVGAKGVYQFMEVTARKSYLLIDKKREIDERLSPLKSSIAAARLLRDNRRVLKTWPLATIAYNAGMVQLFRIPRKVRRRQSIGKILDPKKNRYRLGYASRNYYPEFLAMLLAEQYRDRFFDLPSIPAMDPVRYRAMTKETSLIEFAREQGHGIRALQKLNPDVRNPAVKLPKGFRIALPGSSEPSDGPQKPLEEADISRELKTWPMTGQWFKSPDAESES